MIILLKLSTYLLNEYIDIWLVMFTLFAYSFHLFSKYNGIIFLKELFICDGAIGGVYLKAKVEDIKSQQPTQSSSMS